MATTPKAAVDGLSGWDTRPNRNAIKDGLWLVTAKLVIDRPTGSTVLVESEYPLQLSDSWFNSNHRQAGNNIAMWMDDQAQRHARVKKRGR